MIHSWKIWLANIISVLPILLATIMGWTLLGKIAVGVLWFLIVISIITSPFMIFSGIRKNENIILNWLASLPFIAIWIYGLNALGFDITLYFYVASICWYWLFLAIRYFFHKEV